MEGNMSAVEMQSKDLAIAAPLSGMGLEINQDATYEQWAGLGKKLAHIGKAWQFWVGDWLLFGELKWGEKYAQAATETGLAEQTLKNCQWVAGRVQKSLRRDLLSWSHHVLVAEMEPDQQKIALDKAEKEGWSVTELRAHIKDCGKKEKQEKIGSETCAECGAKICVYLLDNGSTIALDPRVPVYETDGNTAIRSKTALVAHSCLCGRLGPTRGIPGPKKRPLNDKQPSNPISRISKYDGPPGPEEPYAIIHPLQSIVIAYKVLKGYEKQDRQWDKHYFHRFAKPAKKLLDVFNQSWRESVECMEGLSERFESKKLDWTLDTIYKYALDWKKEQEKK